MGKAAEVIRLLNGMFDKSPVQVWPAIVKSVEGQTCTVAMVNTDLVIDDVRLRADQDATEGVTITPRVDSFVLVSVIENSIDNLYVCQVSEVDKIEGVIGKASIMVDKNQVKAVRDSVSLTLSDKATLKQDQTVVELASGKVSIKNASTSLKSIIDDVSSLFQTYQVTCAAPGAPSAPFPSSVAKAVQLQTKAATLLT